jgi:hypothetical protein
MHEQDLAKTLKRLNDELVVPPVDASREAALMAAFESAPRTRSRGRAGWWMTALAAAAALLVAAALPRPPRTITPAPAPVHAEVTTEFVIVPGAAELPVMESGTLVRVDLPVSVLPSFGVIPPAVGRSVVKADLVVGQDGLTRAVRLVN